jgi:phosphoglycolate phosphatase
LRQSRLPAVSEALTRHWVGHGARMLMQQALQDRAPELLNDEACLPAMLEVFLGHYEAHIADYSEPYPHVVATLKILRDRGAHLAVVTNKVTRLCLPLLDALGLTALFDTVVCGDTAANPKPSADPALYACTRLGIEPQHALFVGDSKPDVDCARAAGCPVVVVANGYNHGIAPQDLGADRVIDSFADLV